MLAVKLELGGTTEDTDWVDLAFRLSRTKFVAACPFPFLVVEDALAKPERPQPTQEFSRFDGQALLAKTGDVPVAQEPGRAALFPVRKVRGAFSSMISLGRTANNDVVVPDVTISRFHAFFREEGGAVYVGDAGSRNGTWAGVFRLEPKGPVRTVTFGTRLRFGGVHTVFLGAGETWERVRASSD